MPRIDEPFRRALAFALRAHGDQTRKGGDVPYVSHLLQVAGLAMEHGADEEQAMAALLHDTLEDTEADYGDLASRFGDRVAAIVRACSDSEDPAARRPWRERKEAYLRHLAELDADAALVSCADKVHNARTIVTDLRTHGPASFARFTGGRDGTLWYYASLVEALEKVPVPPALYEELRRTVDEMRRLAEA